MIFDGFIKMAEAEEKREQEIWKEGYFSGYVLKHINER